MDGAIVEGFGGPISFEEEPQEQKEFVKEADVMASLTIDARWEWVKSYWQERIDFYRGELAGADVSGMTLEEVGRRYLVCDLLAKEIEAFIAKVELTAAEASKDGPRN